MARKLHSFLKLEAIFRAAQSVGGQDRFLAEQLAGLVVARLEAVVHGAAGPRAA